MGFVENINIIAQGMTPTNIVAIQNAAINAASAAASAAAIGNLVNESTIATLRDRSTAPAMIYVTGYSIANDNAFGSHFFKWNPTSSAQDNGGTIIKLTGTATGRYELQYGGNTVNVKWFNTLSNAILSGFKLDFESNTTINVPSDISTIQGALNIIGNIIDDVYVTIKVADGTYGITSGINVNHPCGLNIKLIGNETTASNCVLQVTGMPTFNMISCSNGNAFGYINGFRINATTKATISNNYSGIIATNGSAIVCGSNIEVNNFYYGINSSYNSTIVADYSKVSNAGDVGIWAFCGSFVSARYASSVGAVDSVNGYGYGIQAEYGSNINCEYATVSGCYIAGIAALSNSQVRALNVTSNSNTGTGIYARDNGSVESHNATAQTNGTYGVQQYASGRVFGNNMSISGNTTADYSSGVFIDNTTLGARLVSNFGDMRIDNAGANSWYFNSSGGLQFAINHAASSVNHVYVKGGATGSPAELGAAGNDSIIDLALFPKGAGSYIKIGANFNSSSDAPVTGYIGIKDNTGTIRKLAIIA
jgi:hypothetical protein